MEKATGADSDARAGFLGHWDVERHVHDLASAWTGRFDGRASFAPVPGGGLAYAETGLLRLGGLRMHAAQRYRFLFPAPDRVEVRFETGAPFHAFDPRAHPARADYACGGDLYEVSYFLSLPEAWRSEWRVEGPRKNYRLVTRYARPGGADVRGRG